MYKEELLDFAPAKSNFKDTWTRAKNRALKKRAKRCINTDRTIKKKKENQNMIFLLKRTTGNKM